MYILHIQTGKRLPASIGLVNKQDWDQLTYPDFFFDWTREKKNELWKLTLKENPSEILGVMSLINYSVEARIEIRLIASNRHYVGKEKKYSRIAGCLIAWACRLAVQRYAAAACVSLTPKTELRAHYMKAFGMMAAGRQLYLDDGALFDLIKTYLDDGI